LLWQKDAAKNQEVGMTTRVSAYSYILVILLGLGGSSAWAQVDPTKVLVGTWIGHFEVPRDSERALVIRSVKPKDGGGWIADGRYGYTVEKMGRREIEVSLQGSDIVLEFTTGEKNPARLKLVGENRLEGTLNVVYGNRTSNRGFKLEKAESKQGEPK
jgi:hypothetical protein